MVAAISIKDFTEGFRNAAQVIDFSPLCKILAIELVASCKDNIDRSQSPDGTPFLPLKRPRPNSKGGDLPLQDTGALRSSIVVIYVGGRGFVVGSNLEYSAIHQFGGRIVPKRGKYLAIPATVQAKRTGSPRNWSKGELKLMFGRRGGVAKDLKGAIQYYFTREVTIPARPYLGVSAQHSADMEQMAADYVQEETARTLERSWGMRP